MAKSNPALAELFKHFAYLQPTPDHVIDNKSPYYRTAVYVDDEKYVVFCKHGLSRTFYNAVEMPPELAVNLAMVAARCEEPKNKHESAQYNAITALAAKDHDEYGSWVAPNLYMVILSLNTHERLIEDYIDKRYLRTLKDDPGSKSEEPSQEDTGAT